MHAYSYKELAMADPDDKGMNLENETEINDRDHTSGYNTVDSDNSQALAKKNVRNLIGFWMLGLCNNYGYVIMLSAAHDLLNPNYHGDNNDSSHSHENTNSTNSTHCNSLSTGAILLADILPTLLVKSVAPFITIGTHYRVITAIFLSSGSFIITSLSKTHWVTFLGVVCASFSSGLGEITFLSYSSFFDKNVVSTWSSGTGGAGVIGATSYAALTHFLSPRTALLVMLVVPFVESITFWILIEHPPLHRLNFRSSLMNLCSSEMEPILKDNVDLSTQRNIHVSKHYTLKEKIALVKPLLKYMVPLGLVYFAEYFINQGLMELLYFPKALGLTQSEQYRWYQVDYQVGVLISRSSVNILQIHKLWILPIFQCINVVFLLLEVCFPFLPSIWIVLILILYEGLLGGAAYVNTFYKISSEVSPDDKEFSMGIASLADSMGIALAGVVSLPVHDALCENLSRPSY